MKQYCLLVFLCFIANLALASGLPPKHEAERLFLALKESVAGQNWPQAVSQLSLMRELDVKQPSESYYYEGLIKVRSGEFYQARLVLEQYVINSGSKGTHYEDALRLITEAENAEKNKSEAATLPKPSLEILGAAQKDGYIKSLQALYLTQSPIEALVLQLNSLLSAHPYTGSRIKKSGVKEGVVYQIGVINEGLTIQEKSYQNGSPMLGVNSLSILGLDPFISADCSSKEYACWLHHPSDKHARWIKIDYDELVVEELREAMTKLLQSLQKEK